MIIESFKNFKDFLNESSGILKLVLKNSPVGMSHINSEGTMSISNPADSLLVELRELPISTEEDNNFDPRYFLTVTFDGTETVYRVNMEFDDYSERLKEILEQLKSKMI